MKNNRSVLIYLFFCLLLVGSTGCSKKMSSIYLTTSESLNRGYDTSRELVAIDPVLYKSRALPYFKRKMMIFICQE